MKDSLEDWLVTIKYIPKNYISKIKTRHTIACPGCFKIYHQILPYRNGQNTLCKECRNKLGNKKEILKMSKPELKIRYHREIYPNLPAVEQHGNFIDL